TSAVEAAVDDGAAERFLRPRASVADRYDVDVGVEGERAAAAGARQPRDDQRMGRERRRRSDIPAVDLEAEGGEEVADVTDAAARLVREMGRLLRLALGAEGHEVAEEVLQLRLGGCDGIDDLRPHYEAASTSAARDSTLGTSRRRL